jgi:hypothetical protein
MRETGPIIKNGEIRKNGNRTKGREMGTSENRDGK